MLICTTWKARPLSPEQTNRMMDAWGKVETANAEDANSERLCWYISSDGSRGFTVSRVDASDGYGALALEQALALGEFLEIESFPVLDLDAAMPAITNAVTSLSA